MTDINKQDLIEQIDAAISALDIPNDATQELSFYIKTAINAGTSISDIGTEIASRVASIDTLSDVEEVLLLSVATSLITRDRIVTVSDLSTLQGFSSDISAGTIYYVESEGAPYIKKTNGTWVLLDPSIQPLATINGWAWGINSNGELGDGTTISKSSPVSIIGEFSDWIQLSAGNRHNLGIRNNGTLWAWGTNGGGVLGINQSGFASRSSPVSVVGGFEDWTFAFAARDHSLGIRSNGTLWAWGDNNSGRLGDGTTITKSSPVSVVGGFTDWEKTSGSSISSNGIRSNGTAWSWGSNFAGILGDGTETSRSSPVSIVGGFTDWKEISSGQFHGIGIRANGTAWGWGLNNGCIGDGTVTNRSSPVSVVGGFTDWVQVVGGLKFSLGIRANGTAWAWGLNSGGTLGDGTETNRSSPVSVVGGYTDWVFLSAPNGQPSVGLGHSAGIRANGTAWGWGRNADSELGDGTTINKSSPVSVVGGFNDWVQISAGSAHTLGVRIA